jgi:hypothetical protein
MDCRAWGSPLAQGRGGVGLSPEGDRGAGVQALPHVVPVIVPNCNSRHSLTVPLSK